MNDIWDELLQYEIIARTVRVANHRQDVANYLRCRSYEYLQKRLPKKGFANLNLAHIEAIDTFQNNPIMGDSILSFMGFYATAQLENPNVTFEEALKRFNERAWHFFCLELDESLIRSFLEVYNFEAPKRREFLAAWAILKHQCSVWHKRDLDEFGEMSDEKAFREMPDHVRIRPQFAVWILDGVKKS